MSGAVGTPTDPAAPPGERRQVTALFADMVGFAAISERLGEESTFALIQPIYELMARAVREQGGSVKDFTGDGAMALFGVPDALEDGPLRACRAGLAIHERLAAAASAIEAKHGVRPQMRIGVNSGLAVVAQIHGESGPVTALGDTVNLASRLQTLAEPGTVYLSEATQRLVKGLVETTFAGVHAIKGKTEPQKVYRLDALRQGATRFEAAVGRGLSAYVGRERELEALERNLDFPRHELRVVDIAAEPGMGKSRLLHEFRRRLAAKEVFVLSGSCSPDGQQTPLLPFIEVVRGAFLVSAGEPEKDVARKLESGLTALGQNSPENLGLLLNLLGLTPPENALAGLDGLLIGLRTRDLLLALLEARTRISPLALLIEDLHWIDGASEELLGKIVGADAKLRAFVLLTRRPEYRPPWASQPNVAKLPLEPLPAGDVRQLVRTRLGVSDLPDALAHAVTDRADGNALFAEEIVTFLTEHGVLRVAGGKIEFDAGAVAAALPSSIQSLLTARVDKLAADQRALLQAASVIGRRFGQELLASVTSYRGDVRAALADMEAIDLVHVQAGKGEYAFKHVLVRDALYQSLLTAPRATLHLKIAEEIERRSDNRLAEVVETLAHHYGQTDRVDKAFAYRAWAGSKSFGVYSLDEADKYFTEAITLLDKRPDCASDEQVAELLVDYTLCSNTSLRLTSTTECVERFMPRLGRLKNNSKCVLVHHHYVLALVWSGRYQEAQRAQANLSIMAGTLHDIRSRAYEIASAIHVSTIVSPYPTEVFEAFAREALEATSALDDPYIRLVVLGFIGWDEFHRGRMSKADVAAQELIALGRRTGDPRSTGLAMQLLTWRALTSDDSQKALAYAETGLTLCRTEFDRIGADSARVVALVVLKNPEAFNLVRERVDRYTKKGWRYNLAAVDCAYGIAMVLRGDIGAGLRWIEQAISRLEEVGYHAAADWYRILLCDVYLEILSSKRKPPFWVLARNAVTLITIIFKAQGRIIRLVERARQNPQFDPNGFHIGRCELILGLLYKAKKKRALALQHLTEATRIFSQFGPSPILTKCDAALAELA